MFICPVTLEGRFIRLEPLAVEHHEALCEVGLDEELWRWTPQPVRNPEELRDCIEAALEVQAAGTALPIASLEKASG